jgi:hypothetical protein
VKNHHDPHDPPPNDPPPILGRWRNLYALVLLNLALDIFLLWLFTRAFA